jgi:pyridoxamine 5'-phosphate oxidase-like protein
MRRVRSPGNHVGNDPHQRSQSRQGPLRSGRSRARSERADAEAWTQGRHGPRPERRRRAPRTGPPEGLDIQTHDRKAWVREAFFGEAPRCEALAGEAREPQALLRASAHDHPGLIPGVDERVRPFLEKHHSAAVATIKADGAPHVARIGIALMGDVIWSSGTRNRVRTRNLRRDPRATLFVFDPRQAQSWMGIESHVRILDGPDAPN